MTYEFLKYFVVVSVGLIIDVGLLYLLTSHTDMWYLIASGISFTTALVFNYILSVKIVFKRKTFDNSLYGFVVFAGIGVSALLINQLVLYIGVTNFELPVLHAKIIALPLTFIWNFTLNKIILFK